MNDNDKQKNGDTWADRWGNRGMAWMTAILGLITVVGGVPVASYYVGRSIGSNEYILNLPADLKATKELLDRRIDLQEERYNKLFTSQIEISEATAKTMNDMSRDLSVNKALDETTRANLERLQTAVENMRIMVTEMLAKKK